MADTSTCAQHDEAPLGVPPVCHQVLTVSISSTLEHESEVARKWL
jgi:hypothetical protein